MTEIFDSAPGGDFAPRLAPEGQPVCNTWNDTGDWQCTAQVGHAGPLHVAFEGDGRAVWSWPVDGLSMEHLITHVEPKRYALSANGEMVGQFVTVEDLQQGTAAVVGVDSSFRSIGYWRWDDFGLDGFWAPMTAAEASKLLKPEIAVPEWAGPDAAEEDLCPASQVGPDGLFCTARIGHGGDVHAAYQSPDGRLLGTWPIGAEGPPDPRMSAEAVQLVDMMRRFTTDVLDLGDLAGRWDTHADQLLARAKELGPGHAGHTKATEADVYRLCARQLRERLALNSSSD